MTAMPQLVAAFTRWWHAAVLIATAAYWRRKIMV